MVKGMKAMGLLSLLIAPAVIGACAFDIVDVKYQPARLESVANDRTEFTLAADIPIQGAPCGYSRSLRKGSRWFAIGRISEGVVFRSQDQTLTIECSNVFEAYLVVAIEKLVGFYLPVEKGFSPLSEPIELEVSR